MESADRSRRLEGRQGNSGPKTGGQAQVRIREVLADLETVRENLLAFSDDLWLDIEHNDNAALEEGVAFKRDFNERFAAFEKVAGELSELVQRFTKVRPQDLEETGSSGSDENARIIRELDRHKPYPLDADLTYKRPHGFILNGRATVGVATWRRVYELICLQLLERNRSRFLELPEHPALRSKRGHNAFSRNAGTLRSPFLIAEGIYAEVNLSANHMRDAIRDVLKFFGTPEENLQLFLRQDRDARDI